jgi:hypothetical protein
MTRLLWTATALGIALPRAFSGDKAITTQPPQCGAMIEALLPVPDSIVVLTPQTQCATVRLILAGSPRNPPLDEWRGISALFEIPIQNIGRGSIGLPLEINADSITPVQRGRQLNAFYARALVALSLWYAREREEPGRFLTSGNGATVLASGQQSEVRRLTVTARPLTQGFRVWLSIRGDLPESPNQSPAPVARRIQPPTAPPETAVEQFVATARFPNQKAVRVMYRDSTRQLVIFDVAYGMGHDCYAGCFYSHAVGMAYGHRIGWLHSFDYDHNDSALTSRTLRDPPFQIEEGDSILLSGQLLDTLTVMYGDFNWLVEQVLLPTILGSPHVPRTLLARYVERLYPTVNQWHASVLIRHPKVLHDPGLLTLIANLPDGGPPYEGARNTARQTLGQLGPELVRDLGTSTRTLFVLAQSVQNWPDPVLRSSLLKHPKARNSPAILAVLEDPAHPSQTQILAAVHASDRVKRMLADYLDRGWQPRDSLGWRLLRDPEAGWNTDVLLVLVNLSVNNGQGIAWTASRRLPEESLRRWEPDYIPFP